MYSDSHGWPKVLVCFRIEAFCGGFCYQVVGSADPDFIGYCHIRYDRWWVEAFMAVLIRFSIWGYMKHITLFY